MVEIISEMLDIKKLAERTKIGNDKRFMRPNSDTLYLRDQNENQK